MNWRYEIKYVLKRSAAEFLDAWLAGEPMLRRSYPARRVNSIYLDTPDYQCATDNLSGYRNRCKFRVRWYGDESCLTDAVFEIKMRRDRLGAKEGYAVPGLTRFEQIRGAHDAWLQTLGENALVARLAEVSPLLPVMSVHYVREYFEAAEGLRLTVDRALAFRDVSRGFGGVRRGELEDDTTVVEFKFPPEKHGSARVRLGRFPCYPSRSPKYVTGLSVLGDLLYL